MRKVLIIKAGETFESIKKAHGDFEDYIIDDAGLSRDDVIIFPVYHAKEHPELKHISKIIITGSHSMVTDHEDWSMLLARWIKETFPVKHIDVLGICYGHQLLAHAFGGVVDYHPKGIEIGTVQVELTAEGLKDPLLGCMPKFFAGHAAHSQTVVKLPPGATLLARNSFEGHHAFVIHGNMWGVQFHPEFSAAVTLGYINELQQRLSEEKHDITAIKNSVNEHNFGRILLKNFLALPVFREAPE
jgi:GMP synthase (glutamine-hydrolysing)